jgi:hypothetical protein
LGPRWSYTACDIPYKKIYSSTSLVKRGGTGLADLSYAAATAAAAAAAAVAAAAATAAAADRAQYLGSP